MYQLSPRVYHLAGKSNIMLSGCKGKKIHDLVFQIPMIKRVKMETGKPKMSKGSAFNLTVFFFGDVVFWFTSGQYI